MKGPLGTITQILITVAIMVSNVLGLVLPDLSDIKKIKPEDLDSFAVLQFWRVMFAIPIGLALL